MSETGVAGPQQAGGVLNAPPKTLKGFYDLMAFTRPPRMRAVQAILDDENVTASDIDTLRKCLKLLQEMPGQGMRRTLALEDTPQENADNDTIELDLSYEIGELEKDILYLEKGQQALLERMRELHKDFDSYLRQGMDLIKDISFNSLISDRDGTTNNYCGRYLSSIQSAYNAVFLTRFARRWVTNPMLLTSAPLREGGIVDVSVIPPRTFIYAASKGRECLDLTDRRRSFPIPDDKQALLNTFNKKLEALVAKPGNEKFALIGSGLQRKFGQTTVARQDISGVVPPEESKGFLDAVAALVREVDPDEEHFRIEDTGLDIEIILTIEHESEGLKDFDKGDGVAYLDDTLLLNLAQGPHLVCGDTGSDVPMLRVTLEQSPETYSIFVTQKPELAEKVRGLCQNALIVPEPDMLVTIMGQL